MMMSRSDGSNLAGWIFMTSLLQITSPVDFATRSFRHLLLSPVASRNAISILVFVPARPLRATKTEETFLLLNSIASVEHVGNQTSRSEGRRARAAPSFESLPAVRIILATLQHRTYLSSGPRFVSRSYTDFSLLSFRWAFFITFGGYFMAHFSRKCYSTVKQQLQKQAGYSALLLSEMDTVFMATYAAGNIINGKLGDTFNPTTILAIGLFGSGACLFLINVAIWFDFEGFSAALGNFFILAVYFLFGFFQATGGPVGTAGMFPLFLGILSTFKTHNSVKLWEIGSVTLKVSRSVAPSSDSGRATSTAEILLPSSVPHGFLERSSLTGGHYSSHLLPTLHGRF